MKFIRFPKIKQYREVVKGIQLSSQFVGVDENKNPIYDKNKELPILVFNGTVKLHGTNAGICYNKVSGYWAQNRTNIITPEQDNAGFAFYATIHSDFFIDIFNIIAKHNKVNLRKNTISLFGEWCGGNIQKGIAISGLPKMFVLFGVKVTAHDTGDSYWLPIEFYMIDVNKINEKHFYFINQFETYSIAIDFNNPKDVQNSLIAITNEVEAQCPVGKCFNREGIGEGVVWTCEYNGTVHRFKVKGEKHSATKVKKLASVDTEKLNSIKEFVEYACTENRLEQGIEQVFVTNSIEPTIKQTGDFVRWCINDVIKEEMDTLADNNLEPKEVNASIAKKASRWYIDYLDKQIFNK